MRNVLQVVSIQVAQNSRGHRVKQILFSNVKQMHPSSVIELCTHVAVNIHRTKTSLERLSNVVQYLLNHYLYNGIK